MYVLSVLHLPDLQDLTTIVGVDGPQFICNLEGLVLEIGSQPSASGMQHDK